MSWQVHPVLFNILQYYIKYCYFYMWLTPLLNNIYYQALSSITRRVPLVEQKLLTLPRAPEFIICFGVHVAQSLVLISVWCSVDHCLSLFFWSLCCLSFFFWSLCCLSFFDLQFLITPLVSSNFSVVPWYSYFIGSGNRSTGRKPSTCSK